MPHIPYLQIMKETLYVLPWNHYSTRLLSLIKHIDTTSAELIRL